MPPLHQDIQHSALLIHGPPEVMVLVLECEEDLIKRPLILRPWAAAPQGFGKSLAKLPTPVPHVFV